MGFLIIVLIPIIIWKMINLAKQKEVRLKKEAAEAELAAPAQVQSQGPIMSFAFDFTLESGEVILETTADPRGLWIRIGQAGMTKRIILVDFSGKIIGQIEVKRDHEKAMP